MTIFQRPNREELFDWIQNGNTYEGDNGDFQEKNKRDILRGDNENFNLENKF